MKKRGQVSVFIMIALVIVAIIAVIFIANSKLNIFNQNPADVSNVNNVIQECANQRALDAVRLIGLQGGYTNLPDKYLETNISNIAYGYYDGVKTLPSKTTIAKEIDYYIETTTRYCIEEGDFPQFNVTLGKPKSTAKIEDNQVSVTLKLPASIAKGTKTYTTEGPYELVVPIRLGKIYSTAAYIIDSEIKNSANIELSKLSSLDYYITVIPVNDTNIIYVITDEESSIDDGIPYSFLFANKFMK